MSYVERTSTKEILKYLGFYPVTAILGPRQCGKSTLAKRIIHSFPNTIYIDLELPSDMAKLQDAEAFFTVNNDSLICLDEIQRLPDIFPLIRSIVDRTNKPGRFLLLGSASAELMRQSSESLAGRIGYINLSPFNSLELEYKNLRNHWLKGGFPLSYLSADLSLSSSWRENFIRTFLEKDVPALGFSVSTEIIRRLWMMLAHNTGQILNKNNLSASLGISQPTVTSYIDLLKNTFMVRTLRPCHTNLKKRLIKSPKVYIRDSGIIHSLLKISDQNDLLGHPVYGSSWESYALEQIITLLTKWTPSFYRTSNGSEIDLILEKGQHRIAVEFKINPSLKLSAGFYHGLNDLAIEESFIICPLLKDEIYPIGENIRVSSIPSFIAYVEKRDY
ncbi:MAG: ATP-binding protein [Spirochaetales bacterium]|nr:ATP-binding protein [Spirochaetales bacterium]